MVQDRLYKEVVRRFEELGLPPSLTDLDQFHDNFFHRGWVMFVRDSDKIANVHLIQPRQNLDSATWEQPSSRPHRTPPQNQA